MHRNRFLELPLPLLVLLFTLFSGAAGSQTEQDFLQPDEAFRLSGKADGPDAVILSWDIADGYYLYRSKFKFSSDDPETRLGEPEYPRPERRLDEFFGEVDIYRNQAQIRIPLARPPTGPATLSITTVSQGCADAGLCYPPQTRKLQIRTAAAESPARNSPLDALSNLGQTLGLGDENEILPAEEAYKLLASVERGNLIKLNWQIADGTYLYQDKLKVRLLKGDGVALGEIELPAAKIKENTIRPDGTFGDLPVYEHSIELDVPLLRSDTPATEIELLVAYQGCAEAGICYPPITKNLAMALPAVLQTAIAAEPDATPGDALSVAESAVTMIPEQAAPVSGAPAEEIVVSEQDRIAATLATGNTWIIILTFFGFGLLLSLTPCVFPMIPILSGIIAGQGTSITTSRAFTLSLVYVLAMSLTYTAAGVLAGLFGQNLQAAFQNPWILSLFALVFVLLALSMFGFYDLQLPSRWQSKLTEASNRQQGGRYTGVAVMGLLSALIVGPCVAPPLAGALIYIGQSGDALLGGLGLFALSMGMGAPLMVIGTSAGKLLPRAGAWMDIIKAVFGVGMLAVAIVLLERIIPPAVAMLLWGVLMIVSAVYLGALQQLPIEASGWDRMWRGLGCVLLVYGTLMLVGAAAGGKDTVQPLRGLVFGTGGGTAGVSELHFKRIKTVADLEREVAAASDAGKPVMLDFYADWCVTCKEMERYTFSDPAVIAALNDFTLLQADVTANDQQDQALLQGHFGMPGPPSIMFYNRDGKELAGYRVVGFMPAEEFVAHIEKAGR